MLVSRYQYLALFLSPALNQKTYCLFLYLFEIIIDTWEDPMEMLKQGSITASLRGHFDVGGPFLGFSSMLLLLMLTQYGNSPNHTVLSPINSFNTKLLCIWYKTRQLIGRPATVFPPEHKWVHLSKRQYCLACRVDKIRVSRQPLAEVDGNGAKRRRRGAHTMWGCSACPNSAA